MAFDQGLPSLIPGVCDGTLRLTLARRGVVEHHNNWIVNEAVLATFRWVAVGIFLLKHRFVCLAAVYGDSVPNRPVHAPPQV